MKVNLLKYYSVYDYGKGCIIVNDKDEKSFGADIQLEFRLLGGSLFKGTSIEKFKAQNKAHSIDWIKDISKRFKPEKPVFWSFMFAGYKKPVIEDYCKKLADPKFDASVYPDKLKALQKKYKKPTKQAKKDAPKDSAKITTANKESETLKAKADDLIEKLKKEL